MRLKNVSLPARRRQWTLAVVFNSSVLLAAPALADEGDVLRPYVGASFSYNDNVLGITDDAAAAGTARPSDTTRRLEAGLILDKTISQQRVTANLNLNRTSFNRFSNLDYTGNDISANWNWRAGSHVDGNIGATHSRTLTPFEEYHTANLNMRNQDRQYVNGGWLFHPSYKVHGGISHYRLTYDVDPASPAAAALLGAERTVNDIEIGADYLARSGSSIGLVYRHARGSLTAANSSYDQDELKGKVDWKYSGKTDLQFLGGWVRWKDDAGRSFSGFNARVDATWRATYKITIKPSIWREVSAANELTAAYALTNGVGIAADWELDAKLRLAAELQRQNRDYALSGVPRQDTYNSGTATLTYSPTRNWRIMLSIFRNSLGSDVPNVAFTNKGASLATRLEF
ncbi:MAG: outer membrane beta-barrel protein [Burkholderiales bacterium]|nr:outer membrane beta-barrel protein [Burkholderiales bacterium]